MAKIFLPKGLPFAYGLATAHVLYLPPDGGKILQTLTFQHHDLAPHFPKTFAFADFWNAEIEGVLHEIHVAFRMLAKSVDPERFRSARSFTQLH